MNDKRYSFYDKIIVLFFALLPWTIISAKMDFDVMIYVIGAFSITYVTTKNYNHK